MVVSGLKFACGGFIRASDLVLVVVVFILGAIDDRLQRRSARMRA
jgi:hypothetical protein